MSDLLGVPLGYIYIYYIVFQRMISVTNRSMPFEIQRILDPTGSDYGFISCTETAQAYGREVQHGGFLDMI